MSSFRIQLVLALLLSGTQLALPVWPQVHPIDAQHSVITVHVFKSGLFSAFADNHEIRAPISGGFLDEAGRRAELVIDSRQLMALDPGLAPEKRHEVQQRMLGPEVLDSDRFREIRFEASEVEQIRQDTSWCAAHCHCTAGRGRYLCTSKVPTDATTGMPF